MAITYEKSFSLPENVLEEVIQGESRLIPPTKRGHDRLLRRLEALLAAQLSSGYQVLGPGVGLGITREPFTYRIPDKMVFPAGVDSRMDNPIYIWETPLLIVECLSPGNRKGPVEELLSHYEMIRTPEVWVLDPERRACKVYQNGTLYYDLKGVDAIAMFQPQTFLVDAVSEQEAAPRALQMAGGTALIPLSALWSAFEQAV
jgi:Uma2 family endonuclease